MADFLSSRSDLKCKKDKIRIMYALYKRMRDLSPRYIVWIIYLEITEKARHVSKGFRASLGWHTYLWHTIPQTPQVSHSAVCRQPAASSTHSGSSPHWSHTQAHSHCCTGGHRDRSLWLVLESAYLWHLNRNNHYQRKHLFSFSAIPIVSIKVFDLAKASFKDTQK